MPVQGQLDRDQRGKSLEKVLLLSVVTATSVVPLIYISTSDQLETGAAVINALIVWAIWALSQLGLRRYIAHALVIAVMLMAVVGVLAFGSVRSGTNFLFVAAVACAGIFLGQKALVAAVAFSVLSLGGLVWAEANGLLRPANFHVGLKTWWIQVFTIMGVAIGVFYSRMQIENTSAKLTSELLLRLQRDQEIQTLNETLELRVRDRTADLQRLNNELDSFAYSVSHDLKSPLRSIDGFTHILNEHLTGRLSDEEQALFNRILASTHRMSSLIADMLALARVSQGPLERETVDLSRMARDILEEQLANTPRRQLEMRITPGLSAECDARLMRIALENLFSNALKYTRDQAFPLIEFGQLTPAPGWPQEFFIRDNGVGFSMSFADKLFKPFQRLHMPNEFEGAGVGLATVRRIIERHGGSIRGHGEPGVGATFAFHL